MKRQMSILWIVVVIAFVTVITGCQEYMPFDEHDLTVQTYEKDFISTFGVPAQNHQWGFDQQPVIDYSASQTRVYINPNSNQWASDFHLNVPEAITNDEMTYVKNWFSNPANTRNACEAVHFEDFFIQHVSCDRGNMSELHVKNMDGSDIHINSFNGNSGAIMYVGQAGTEAWSYASTSSTGKYYRQWDLFYTQYLNFTVNGKEYEGWYIGFDYEFAKENVSPESGEYSQFIFRDGIYNDWIVKVSPALHDTNSTKRVMCEDLGATADWDYNDVVFDVSFTQEDGTYYANIALRAVSGTLPIYVGKYNSAYEAHKLIGDGSLNPICSTRKVSVYKVKLSELGIQSTIVNSASANAIPVYVDGPDGVYTLANSSIAQKLACPTTTAWVGEGVKISSVYSDFEKWVSDESIDWTESSNSSGSTQNGEQTVVPGNTDSGNKTDSEIPEPTLPEGSISLDLNSNSQSTPLSEDQIAALKTGKYLLNVKIFSASNDAKLALGSSWSNPFDEKPVAAGNSYTFAYPTALSPYGETLTTIKIVAGKAVIESIELVENPDYKESEQ